MMQIISNTYIADMANIWTVAYSFYVCVRVITVELS